MVNLERKLQKVEVHPWRLVYSPNRKVLVVNEGVRRLPSRMGRGGVIRGWIIHILSTLDPNPHRISEGWIEKIGPLFVSVGLLAAGVVSGLLARMCYRIGTDKAIHVDPYCVRDAHQTQRLVVGLGCAVA